MKRSRYSFRQGVLVASSENGSPQKDQRIGSMVKSLSFPASDFEEDLYTIRFEEPSAVVPKVVTPLASEPSDPDRWIGTRIAKVFGNKIYLGEITETYESDNQRLYHVAYEDGDSEDFDDDELREGISLYARRKRARSVSFQPLCEKGVPIHTLILGSHPGAESLFEKKYFVNPSNAFWWIVGDCLGFRRDVGTKTDGTPMKLCEDLRYDVSRVLPYHEQVRTFCHHGFALWDIVASCERKGSLDRAITKDTPNDVRKFVEDHPTIRSIVFANGKSTMAIFLRHFGEWCKSGRLVFSPCETSDAIECICAASVSPAATTMTYREKRDFWDKFVFTPGLRRHKELAIQQAKEGCIPK